MNIELMKYTILQLTAATDGQASEEEMDQKMTDAILSKTL